MLQHFSECILFQIVSRHCDFKNFRCVKLCNKELNQLTNFPMLTASASIIQRFVRYRCRLSSTKILFNTLRRVAKLEHIHLSALG